MFSISSLRLYTLKSLLIGLGSISCVSVMHTPAEAATLNVPSSQYPTIQSAINAANRGDTIVVEAGRTYTENLVLRYKSGSGYVTIQSSALASLPAAGNRVGPSDASNMPTIRSTSAGSGQAISTVSGANPTGYYKLIGLQILRHNSTAQQYQVVALGTDGSSQNTIDEVPHNIIIDRCLIRGADNASTRRGIRLDAKDSQVINSYIDNFWETGADSQAIAAWNGGQNVLIANNFIEGAAQNLMFGGSDPSIPNHIPNTVTIEHNHFFKRLSWIGASKAVKHLLELKNAQNVTIQNNIFENHWADASAGYAILFTPRNQGGTAPWSNVEHITFRYNIVKNVARGFGVAAADLYASSGEANNIEVSNNLWDIAGSTMGTSGWLALINRDGGGYADAVHFDHNTFVTTSNSASYFWFESPSAFLTDFRITNNIVATLATPSWSGFSRSGGPNGQATLDIVAPSEYTVTGNVFQRSSTGMPPSNYYPSGVSGIAFRNVADKDFRLANTSPYKGAAPGGKDIGADITSLNSRTACVVSGQQSVCNTDRSSSYDFDGDGRSDASLYRPTEGVWYLNRSRDGSTGVNFGISTDKVTPADFDGDGKTDVAVFRPENNIWFVLNSSSWSLSVSYFGSVGDLPVPSDYDGDGLAEIAVWRPSDGTWYRVNSTTGQFVAMQFGIAGDRPALGDYDGDGLADLAVFRPSSGVWYLLRSSAGFAAFSFGIGSDVITPADFSGDGRTDIAVFRPSNGTWYRFDQSTGQMSVFQFGTAADVPVPADYDGDGKADLAVFRSATGLWYFQKSTEGFSTLRYGSFGDTPLAALNYASLPVSAN